MKKNHFMKRFKYLENFQTNGMHSINKVYDRVDKKTVIAKIYTLEFIQLISNEFQVLTKLKGVSGIP